MEKKTVRIAATGMELVKIDELVPYARNAKIHSPDQIAKIRASLREYGFVAPVLIDRAKNVIAGHGRIEAARAEGMEKVQCVFVEGLSDAQRRAYIIADNRLTEIGAWDMAQLKIEMDELQGQGFSMESIGFEMNEQKEAEISAALGAGEREDQPVDIDGCGCSGKRKEHILRVDGTTVLMSEAGAEMIGSRLTEYIARNGCSIGFVRSLLYD